VQQTALRRPMLDWFAYCPNAPPCMMTEPPTERHDAGYSEQQVRRMLPAPQLVDNFIGDVLMLAGSDTPPAVSIGLSSASVTKSQCNRSGEDLGARVTRVISHPPLTRQPISCYYYALKQFIHF